MLSFARKKEHSYKPACTRTCVRTYMKTIVFANPKGGSGKTSSVLNLAGAFERIGQLTPMLVDLDERQKSLAEWWRLREASSPELSRATLETLAPVLKAHAADGYRWCFIDTPGFLSEATAAAIELADLVVIPCKASLFDIAASKDVVAMCKRAGRPFHYLANEVTRGVAAEAAAIAAMAAEGPVIPAIVYRRQLIVDVVPSGLTVQEADPRSAATADYDKVASYLLTLFPETAPKRKEKARA